MINVAYIQKPSQIYCKCDSLVFSQELYKMMNKNCLTSKEKLKIKLSIQDLVYKLTIHVKKANKI